MDSRTNKNGFSLVELSIVLVILGLLVGGIMTGQNLIKAAELRSITTEMQSFQTAVNLFKEKYFTMPGDMRNAIQFWGNADGGGYTGECSTPLTNEGTDTQTCNGNGDGVIADGHEMFRFWQHLANAGLITGNFTGAQEGTDVDHHVLGVNAPRAKYSSAGWGVLGLFNEAGDTTDVLAHDYRNALTFGSVISSHADEPVISPEDVWNIDTKVDDGMPATGRLIVRFWSDCTIDTADKDDDTGTYNLANPDADCAIYFADAFR